MNANPIPIRILVDSAIRAEAEPWLRTGVASGVTTNPTLLRRAGLGLADLPEIAHWAEGEGEGATGEGQREVCFQLWGSTVEEQYASAMRLRELAPGATIKVPVSPIGAAVITRLHAQQVPVLMTAVYSAQQMVVASALGVRYLAPYFNRMQVAGRDALEHIRTMTEAVPQDGSGPLVMAASVKSAAQVVELVRAGVRVFTLPPAVIADVFADQLTTDAIGVFEDDMAAILG